MPQLNFEPAATLINAEKDMWIVTAKDNSAPVRIYRPKDENHDLIDRVADFPCHGATMCNGLIKDVYLGLWDTALIGGPSSMHQKDGQDYGRWVYRSQLVKALVRKYTGVWKPEGGKYIVKNADDSAVGSFDTLQEAVSAVVNLKIKELYSRSTEGGDEE